MLDVLQLLGVTDSHTQIYSCLMRLDFVSIKGRFVAVFTEQKPSTFKYSRDYLACDGSTGSDQSVCMTIGPRRSSAQWPPLWLRSQLENRDRTRAFQISDGWLCSFSGLFALDICFYQQCETGFLRRFSEIRDTQRLVLKDAAEISAPDRIWLPGAVHQKDARHQLSSWRQESFTHQNM